ncbi:Asp-tRNA(Asn)/Glu-tRNA(Gln) amidotransferase GatCAB subunit B, partial [archaeon]|nr:Asp-tRNA(Asn)/Glu-tRNA(Gln) amidotransferase GatCAB subunit B [archaeon]
ILRKFVPESFSPKKENIQIISDDKALLKIIKQIIKDNKKSAQDYKSGNKQAINFLIGQVMKETNKSADYQIVRKILEKELK